jgi:hypothetical protein
MSIGAIAGGAAALGGAFLSSKSQDKASQRAASAAAFQPFSIATGVASSTAANIDASRVRKEGLFTANLGSNVAPLQRQLFSSAGDQFGMGGLPGQNQLLGQFGGQDSFFNQFQQGQQGQLGQSQDALQQFLAQSGQLGNQGDALFGGLRRLSNRPGEVDRSAQRAINQGQAQLGRGVRGTVNDTLANLRASARPQEERAVDSRIQSLFSRGTLGSTSGARAIGELGAVQEQADLNRQIQAEQLGQSQFGLQQQAGQGLLGLGQQGLLAGQAQNQTAASILGNLGFQNIGNQGQLNTQGFNAQQQQAGLVGQQGLDRLLNAQQSLGFGQDFGQAQQQQGLQALQGGLGINQDLRNLLALSGNISSGATAAGGNVANALLSGGGSPLGAFATGVGTGVLNKELNI